MQSDLILILCLCVALAIQGYYFGFVRPPETLAWLQKGTFVVMTFVLIPFLLFVLNSQSNAVSRLAETGIKPHPDITESIGIGYGGGKDPNWVFEIDADKYQVRQFYLDPQNVGKWELSTDSDIMLIYKKQNETLTIGFREGHDSNVIFYSLTNN